MTYQISVSYAAEATLGIRVVIISKSDYDKILQSQTQNTEHEIIRERTVKSDHINFFLHKFFNLNQGKPINKTLFDKYASSYDTDYLFNTLDHNKDGNLSMAELSHIRLMQ